MPCNAKAIKAAQSDAKTSTVGSTASNRAAILALENANHTIARLQAKLAYEIQTNEATQKEVLRLKERLNSVISDNNMQKKQAVQRGNRFKAKYKNLLLLFDAILPGAEKIITNKILTKTEKKEEIIKIKKQIEIQKKNVDQMVHYDHDQQRDIYQSGFGREYERLKGLRERLKKTETKKATDEPVEIPAKQE